MEYFLCSDPGLVFHHSMDSKTDPRSEEYSTLTQQKLCHDPKTLPASYDYNFCQKTSAMRTNPCQWGERDDGPKMGCTSGLKNIMLNTNTKK